VLERSDTLISFTLISFREVILFTNPLFTASISLSMGLVVALALVGVTKGGAPCRSTRAAWPSRKAVEGGLGMRRRLRRLVSTN
jgi:hypothetical protein